MLFSLVSKNRNNPLCSQFKLPVITNKQCLLKWKLSKMNLCNQIISVSKSSVLPTLGRYWGNASVKVDILRFLASSVGIFRNDFESLENETNKMHFCVLMFAFKISQSLSRLYVIKSNISFSLKYVLIYVYNFKIPYNCHQVVS